MAILVVRKGFQSQFRYILLNGTEAAVVLTLIIPEQRALSYPDPKSERVQ